MASKKHSGASDQHSSQASIPAGPPKRRWQLILSGVLCLAWLAVLAWLAAGG